MSEVEENVENPKETEDEDTDMAPEASFAGGSSADDSAPADSAAEKHALKSEPAGERHRKRSRSSPAPTETTAATTQAAAVSAAAAAAAAQAALAQGLSGLFSLLSSSVTASSSNASPTMPSVEQVQQAATRAMNDTPPYVHLSSRDSAPQLKIEDGPSGRRSVLKGGMRGYRMARASHGVSEGNYYYEVLVLPPPPIREIIDSLPPNVRLGRNLQKQLEEQLAREEKSKNETTEASSSAPVTGFRKRKRADDDETPLPTIGGNVRIGWSMRTGDLQAPVGYDKWSYGLRDISGSRVHDSRREDHWGGEPFGPGDVVGFAICLVDKNGKSSDASSKKPTVTSNHIRFFKNGEAMGHFIMSRGKREGGAAFEDILEGTYYPAISTYLGGTVKVNFGPHFTYPPRSLPSGLKLRPVSNLCESPPKPEDAVAEALKDRIFKKTDDSIVNAFRSAIKTESQIRYDAHQEHLQQHLEEIKVSRSERNLSIGDLP